MEAASSLCTPCAGRYGFERTHTPGSMCTSAWTPCRRRSSCGIQPTHSRTWTCTPTMRSTDDSGVMVCTPWRELPARDAAEVAIASVGVLHPCGARPPTEVVLDFPATALSRSGGSAQEGVAVVRVHRRTPDARDEPPRRCPWSRVQGHHGGRQCLDALLLLGHARWSRSRLQTSSTSNFPRWAAAIIASNTARLHGGDVLVGAPHDVEAPTGR